MATRRNAALTADLSGCAASRKAGEDWTFTIRGHVTDGPKSVEGRRVAIHVSRDDAKNVVAQLSELLARNPEVRVGGEVFEVHVTRVTTYRVEAKNEDDAVEAYLSGGDDFPELDQMTTKVEATRGPLPAPNGMRVR